MVDDHKIHHIVTPPRSSVANKVRGVVRSTAERELIVVFDQDLTDDDMRAFHDVIRDWRGNA